MYSNQCARVCCEFDGHLRRETTNQPHQLKSTETNKSNQINQSVKSNQIKSKEQIKPANQKIASSCTSALVACTYSEPDHGCLLLFNLDVLVFSVRKTAERRNKTPRQRRRFRSPKHHNRRAVQHLLSSSRRVQTFYCILAADQKHQTGASTDRRTHQLAA